MERNDYLIRKKINKYMLTGVMTTVAIQLGNVVDAMIVGNLLGSIGNGAVSAATPFLYVLQAAAIFLGSGGAVAMAVRLGRRETENAGRIMGMCMLGALAWPLLFTALTPLTVPAYIRYMVHAGTLSDMVRQIITVYSLGMPVVSFVLVMAYLMNVDNHPSLAASMQIVANAVNLCLDFILVKYTPLGVTGSSLATILGYLAAGIIFIPRYFKSKNRMVQPVLKGISKSGALFSDIRQKGLPNLIYLLMTVISVAIMNSSIIKQLGDARYSAYAVANNTQLIVQMFFNGVASVITSVAGALFGDRDYYGMRRVVKRVVIMGLGIAGTIMLVFLLVPGLISGLYGFDNPELTPELHQCLRIFSVSFIFFVLNAIVQNYYKTIGYSYLSTTDNVCEILLLKVPLALLGMHLNGLPGLFTALVVSEAVTFILINLLRLLLQMRKKVSPVGFMAIPAERDDSICDITIRGNDSEAIALTKRIMKYCEEIGVSGEKRLALGMAAEELVSNIGRYAYDDPSDKYIDVCLSKKEDTLYLRLRDDGKPFDPVRYEPSAEAEEEMRGLAVIRKLNIKMSYVRVINLNNTVLEMEIP